MASHYCYRSVSPKYGCAQTYVYITSVVSFGLTGSKNAAPPYFAGSPVSLNAAPLYIPSPVPPVTSAVVPSPAHQNKKDSASSFFVPYAAPSAEYVSPSVTCDKDNVP